MDGGIYGRKGSRIEGRHSKSPCSTHPVEDLGIAQERRKVYLRNRSSPQRRTIQHLPACLPDAEEQSGHHPKRWGKGDGKGEGSKNFRCPGQGKPDFKKPDKRARKIVFKNISELVRCLC